MEDINIAAPGIKLFKIETDKANIRMFEGYLTGCYTDGTYQTCNHDIFLGTSARKAVTRVHKLKYLTCFTYHYKFYIDILKNKVLPVVSEKHNIINYIQNEV